ncbi:MAG: bifunctional folylpolyglutamate synthase/dihydrofolate synthase [Verrucomicrobia bacterium]|nr:bifunctional folylpolyglutamate synthase/dihydrofolate synthase [Verrucomicrobiota bacterium]
MSRESELQQDYARAIRRITGFRQFGMVLGLERPLRLMAALGNPQTSLRFIHVAGTNGKGSTCAFLEAMCRAGGLKTGLFTSPHLVHLGERFQVMRRCATQREILELLDPVLRAVDGLPADDPPTFFEIVTAMALLHFQRSGCEIVIWETGLGGRLDASNIVKPLASLVTSIGWDHISWLGDTLEKIAFEKAGIFKQGVPAIARRQCESVDKVLEEQAARVGALMNWVDDFANGLLPVPESDLGLRGLHQANNARLAVATLRTIARVLPVAESAICEGLRAASWAGRFQVLRRGEQILILDGAHNPDGTRCLVQTLRTEFPGVKPTLVVGMLADKDWQGMLSELCPIARQVIAVPVANERTLAPDVLAAGLRKESPGLRVEACSSLAHALDRLEGADLVCITGSLYLIGEAIELLGQATSDMPSERNVTERL